MGSSPAARSTWRWPRSTATLGPQLQPLVLQSVVGRLGGRLLAGGFDFSTQGLQFNTPDGLRWPGRQCGGDLHASRRARAGERRGSGRQAGPGGPDANRRPRCPWAPPPTRRSPPTRPRAWSSRCRRSWQGLLEAPVEFSARGRVVQLEIAAQPGAAVSLPSTAAAGTPAHVPIGIPGIRGATVDFDLTQAGGKASSPSRPARSTLPGVFEDPVVPLDQLAADVQWQVNGEQIATQLTNVKFSNADAQGDAAAQLANQRPRTLARAFALSRRARPAGQPGPCDGHAGVTATCRWCCRRRCATMCATPCRRAAPARSSSSSRGDLHNIPFADPKQGEFHIAANLQNATFALCAAQPASGRRAALAGADPALRRTGVRPPVHADQGRHAASLPAPAACRSPRPTPRLPT